MTDKASKRNRITKYLMYAPLLMNEVHTRWADVSYTVNPWLSRDYNLDVQWFVLFLCVNLSFVVFSISQIRLCRLQDIGIRVAAWTVFVMSLINLYKFFDNFNKKNDYILIYAGVLIISEVVAGVIKYDNQNDILFQVRRKLRKGQGVQECDATMKHQGGSVGTVKNYVAEANAPI